jgi:mannosyltransferase
MIVLGIALALLGLFMPRSWYEALPWDPQLPPPPIKGVTLLQATFLLEGVALVILGWAGWRAVWGSATVGRIGGGELEVEERPDVSRRLAIMLLAGITVLALALRLLHVNADLWLDEIASIVRYRQFTPLEVLTTYLSSNNHMLNTLLVKWTTGLFGEREWAVRLPAIAFGVATIPAVYWLARLAASRWESLGVALLLAVSYHHIFFSQNARGYTAYLFLSVVTTGLFVRGLLRDRQDTWVWYVVATIANFAALLHSAFVFGAQVLIGFGVALVRRARGQETGPLLRRLGLVFGVTAVLGFQLWATMLPQAYVFIRTEYAKAASGFSIMSERFLADLVLGLREGFGVALPIIGLGSLFAAYGFLVLLRRRWLLGVGLALPLALTAGVLAARGLSTSPRFFLLGLVLADLVVVLGLGALARLAVARIPRAASSLAPRLGAVAVGALAVASLMSLPRYYAVPKQSYRAAIDYVLKHRVPGHVIVLIHTVAQGFRYYAKGTGLQEGRDFVAVRSVAALDEVVEAHGAGHILLVTTFRRALLLELPELNALVEKGWAPAEKFPATIHDGGIVVWTPRPS